MRLKRHREDVADLRLMGDNYVQEIAAKYHRLIIMTEAYFNACQSYFDHKERVVKDAEGKGKDKK